MQIIPSEKQLYRNQKNLTDKDLPAIWETVRSQALQYVDLSYNQSTIEHLVVPKDLPHLKYLYLYDSKIQKITFDGDLPDLEVLHLGKNQLQAFKLPDGFAQLEHLRLDENQLEEFELKNLSGLDNMQSLFLKGNDLSKSSITKENWDKDGNCWQSVQAYLQAAQSGVIINNEAKVVWFGNGEAGKTTLSHQLRKGVFKNFDRTHGIKIEDWTIPFERLPQALKNRMTASLAEAKAQNSNTPLQLPENVVLKLWDFGGQEYYHATHRLFLNSNVLYLLVWNQDTDRQEENLDPSKSLYPRSYWRHNIQYYTNTVEDVDKKENEEAKPKYGILEIQNKADKQASTNEEKLQFSVALRKENDKRSIKRYEFDVEELEEAIISQLHRLSYLGKTFPEVYDHIRQALRNHEGHFLTFDDYAAFCRANDTTQDKENLMLDKAQIQTLTEFLHDTGALICYRYQTNCPKLLKDYVFIRPQWVTDMIYQILDKELIDKKENPGEFGFEHVAQVTQNSGLSAEAWVVLMKQFQLIFEITRKQKKCFIAPQYLPTQCPDPDKMEMAFYVPPTHTFSLRFPNFLPKSHFLQFIAHFGPHNVSYLYWKNGLIFAKNNILIFAQCNYTDRKITLSTTQGPHFQQTMIEIYQWFVDNKKINKNTEISVDGENFVPIEVVKENQSDQIPVFRHGNCKFQISDLWFIAGKHGMGPEEMPDRDFIQDLIANDKISKAIKVLMEMVNPTEQKDLYNGLILLSANQKYNETKKRSDLISNANYKLEKNTIIDALMKYLDEYFA
ncbi:MAG: COR domain-containing protein [Chitinophagales bacterium]